MLIKDKIALVTGSSRGIGRQIALGLAKHGAGVILHGRKGENVKQTLQMISSFRVPNYVVEGELSDEDQVKQIVRDVMSRFGGVDILYNNAAVSVPWMEDFWKHPLQSWEQTFKVNVFALYQLCAAFIPGMVERGYGRVINMTSGIKDQPELAPYGASKAAVDKITEDLAVKLENTGVRINRLDPGWLRTDLGGPNAWNAVEDVMPGALVPAFIENDGPNGQLFSAMELRDAVLE